jgi:L-rhamnose mutarotase
MKTYCLALDLVNDPALIEQYEQHHKKIWPEITASIKDSGIHEMKIYRVENRLMMIIQTDETFSFEEKAKKDESNPRVTAWERLMWNYQKSIPGSKAGEKWRRMELIFDLHLNG